MSLSVIKATFLTHKARRALEQASTKTEQDFGGFTTVELDRMCKALRTKPGKLRAYIKQLGLQGMTTKAALQAIREFRSN